VGKTFFEDGISKSIKHFMKERISEKGFEVEFSRNFKNQQWNKLFVNSVINPITAITRTQNGVVLSEELKGTVKEIIQECVSVACKEGYHAKMDSILDLVYSIASKTSSNTSSMLQDLLKGKRTEIDSINGYLIGLARKHSISIPVNEALYALVKSIENAESKK
jgi:2-dehydropantoate 2-reductase